jgi:hypothetical protein
MVLGTIAIHKIKISPKINPKHQIKFNKVILNMVIIVMQIQENKITENQKNRVAGKKKILHSNITITCKMICAKKVCRIKVFIL